MIRALIISLLALAALTACQTRAVQVSLEANPRSVERAVAAGYVDVVLRDGVTFREDLIRFGEAICARRVCFSENDFAQVTFDEAHADLGGTLQTIASAPLLLPVAVVVATGMAGAGAGAGIRGSAQGDVDYTSLELRVLARQQVNPIVFDERGMTLAGEPCLSRNAQAAVAPRSDAEAGAWVLNNHNEMRSECLERSSALWSDLLDQGERDAVFVLIQARRNWEAVHCDRLQFASKRPEDRAAAVRPGTVILRLRNADNPAGAFSLYQQLVRGVDEIAYDAPWEAVCGFFGTTPVDPHLLDERYALFQEIADLYYRGPSFVVDGARMTRGTISIADQRTSNLELWDLADRLPYDDDGAKRLTESESIYRHDR